MSSDAATAPPTWADSYESVLRSLDNIINNLWRPFGRGTKEEQYESRSLVEDARVLRRLVERLAATADRSPISANWWYKFATSAHRLGNSAASSAETEFDESDIAELRVVAEFLGESVAVLTNAILLAESDAIQERTQLTALIAETDAALEHVRSEGQNLLGRVESDGQALVNQVEEFRNQSEEALSSQKRTVARTAFYVRAEDFANHATSSKKSMFWWRIATFGLSICALSIALWVTFSSPKQTVIETSSGTVTTPVERSTRDVMASAASVSAALGLAVWASRQARDAKLEMSASNDLRYRLNALDAYYSDLNETDRAAALRELAPMLLGLPIFQHRDNTAINDPTVSSELLRVLNERLK